MQNSDKKKKKREGESRKKKYECAFKSEKKKKKRLTQLCVFGYKVGQTIFTAFHPPTKPTNYFIFLFWQRKSKKKKKGH